MPSYPVIHGVKFCPGWEESWRRLPPEVRKEAVPIIAALVGTEVKDGAYGKLSGFMDVPVWTVALSKDGLYIATFLMMDVCAYLQRAGLYEEIERLAEPRR